MQRNNAKGAARLRMAAALTGIGLLAGCGSKPLPVVAPPAPPPPPAPAVMPKPPMGAATGLSIPQPLADGSFPGPNRGLSPAASVWHLRSGLNVAALQCGGVSSDEYNALLKAQKPALNAAFKSLEAEYRAGGGDWQDRFDDTMTRLYNYFAQPPAQKGFCAAAAPVLAEAATIVPAEFQAFSVRGLAAIDRPFADFWASYHRYRTELAAWQAQQPGAAPVVSAGAPAAPPPGGTVTFAPSEPIVQPLPSTPAR